MNQFSLSKALINKHLKNFLGRFISILASFLLLLTPFTQQAEAAKSLMTGDYQADTVSVAKELKEKIATQNDKESLTTARDESIILITDYISRYRNRSQVNGSQSFTTMQTALNAMAGHYKTFSNRPLPEDLKERLNSELTKAEKFALKNS